MTDTTANETLLTLTADIVAAHVGHNVVAADQLAPLIAQVYGALAGLGTPGQETEPDFIPAIAIRNSITPEHLVSLIDGKPYKILKRHLANHGLTPDEYRARYKLKPDYPMIAPGYSAKRRAIAVKIGLGRGPNARQRETGERPNAKA